MKKSFLLSFCLLVTAIYGLAQSRQERIGLAEEIQEARKAMRETPIGRSSTGRTIEEDFEDFDSFGKNVKFLGSRHTGIVYYYHTCDLATFESELGFAYTVDDHCYVLPAPGPNPVEVSFTEIMNITVPGKAVDNVFWPVLNNSVDWENDGSAGGSAFVSYSPRIRLESIAFNDPTAIVNGQPLNGVYEVGTTGNVFKLFTMGAGEVNAESYASILRSGISRASLRAAGLPDSVVDKFFKSPVKLKFGVRTNISGAIHFAQFFYTVRLLGQ